VQQPLPQTQTLAVGGNISYTGSYIQTGTINVSSTPSGVGFQLAGPGLTYYTGNTPATMPNAPAGDYKITWGILLGGYQTPSGETKTLPPGGSISFTGPYTPSVGTISVTSNISRATFVVLQGSTPFAAGTTPYTNTAAPAGSYSVSWGSLNGFVDPPTQTQTLLSGGSISFVGTYVRQCGSIIKGAVIPSVDTEIKILNTVFRQPTMRATFTPNFGLTLSEAAAACGFTDYDWQQTITHFPSPSAIYQVGNPTPLTAPPTFFDPPPNGYTYCVPLFGSPCDQYPFYFNPYTTGIQSLSQYETTNTLSFVDRPSDSDLPPGDFMGFTTQLVGVCNATPSPLCSSLGAPSVPLFQWTWTDTFNGTSGGIATTYNFLPLDQGSGTGIINITTLNGVRQVPPSVSCAATPNALWPPNGQAVVVTVSGIIKAGTQAIAAGGTTYVAGDEYGKVQPSGDFALGAGGQYSLGVSLIAARDGNDHDGRTYTIMVNASDALGNVGSCSAVVTVPHDQGHQ
jgi:hypothetical protein